MLDKVGSSLWFLLKAFEDIALENITVNNFGTTNTEGKYRTEASGILTVWSSFIITFLYVYQYL